MNDLTLRVSAHDNVGNSDTDQLTFLTSSCELKERECVCVCVQACKTVSASQVPVS